MMTKQPLKLVAIAITALLFVSCVDDRYDFDNVDMTIGTTGDLTLPSNSTGDILLGNILDVTEDGVVQAVNGEYYLVEKGNANVPSINISPVSIDRPILSNMNTHIDLNRNKSVSSQLFSHAINMAAGAIPSVAPATYVYTITPDDNATYAIPENTEGSVPSDVVALREISFVDETTLEMHIDISFGKGYEFIKLVHLDNITVTFPNGLHVESAEIVQRINDQDNVLPAVTIDNENGRVVLTKEDRSMNLGSEMVIRMTFDKAFVGKNGITFDGKRVKLNGVFGINGSYRIKSDDFDHNMFTSAQINAIISAGTYDVVCPSGLDMKGVSSFTHDIYVNEINGDVLTTVDDINPISLDDMPDFLNEPEVVLNLVNPVFYVEVNNPLPGKLTTSLALTSKYTDGTPDVRRETGSFELPAPSHNESRCVVRMAETFDNLTLPEKYDGLPVVNVPVEDLSDLLTKLPEAIDVEIGDVRMAVEGMKIPEVGTDQHKVTIDYMVYTPLELGEGTTLVYKGVEEGLSADLEDVNKLDTKAIEIKAVAETNFPLDLTLSVDAQDINDISLVDNIVTVDDVLIPAHKGTEACSYHDLAITIKPIEGHTIRELLQQMDKFVYRAVAHGDGKLLENAYVKLTKIKVTLKGGVSYDAN